MSIFALLLILAAVQIRKVTLSGDPQYLGYTPPALKDRQERLARLFPGASDPTLIVAEGDTEDAALERNDALYEALLNAGVPSEKIISLSPFLPSFASQSRSLAASKQLLAPGSTGRSALERAGFESTYIDGLGTMLNAPPVTPRDYRDTGLSGLVLESIASQNGKSFVMTRVERTVPIDRVIEVARGISGCRVVSERIETSRAFVAIQGDLIRMMGIWTIAALLLIAAVKRSVFFGLRAVLPPIFGVICAVGIFSFLGRPLTSVAAAALTMVLGLGINYGVYVESEPKSGLAHIAGAIFSDGFTTIAGFFVLVFADNRSMVDIGLMVTLGLFAAMTAALLLLPLIRSNPRDASRSENHICDY